MSKKPYSQFTSIVSSFFKPVYLTLSLHTINLFCSSFASGLISANSEPSRYKPCGRSPSTGLLSIAAANTSPADFSGVRMELLPLGLRHCWMAARSGKMIWNISTRMKKGLFRTRLVGTEPGSTPRTEMFDRAGSVERRRWSSPLLGVSDSGGLSMAD